MSSLKAALLAASLVGASALAGLGVRCTGPTETPAPRAGIGTAAVLVAPPEAGIGEPAFASILDNAAFGVVK